MLGLINVTLFEVIAIWGVLFIAILGLGYAFLLKTQIMKKDKGTKEMQEVWDWIKANKGERPNWSWLADMRDRAAMT